MRYYFVSFTTSKGGFGNIFVKANPFLNIREAEEEISCEKGIPEVCVISFNEISEEQYNLR